MDHERPAGMPIPGTTPTPRGLFLDIWGTLCELPPGGRASTPADVRFLPGALDALFACHREGWRLYLVGNETDVALGHVDERTWKRVEETLMGAFDDAGIEITRSYVCTTHPNGVGHLQSDSVYMLPGTGGFYHASHNDGIDIARSWVVGDSTLELVAGWRAGLMTCGVATGRAVSDGEFHVDVDVRHPDLAEFLGLLLRRAFDRAG